MFANWKLVLTTFLIIELQLCSAVYYKIFQFIYTETLKAYSGKNAISSIFSESDTSAILEKIDSLNKGIQDVQRKIEDSNSVMMKELLPAIINYIDLAGLKKEIDNDITKIELEYQNYFIKFSKTNFSGNTYTANKTIFDWSFRITNELTPNYLEYNLLHLHQLYDVHLTKLIDFMKVSISVMIFFKLLAIFICLVRYEIKSTVI